MASEWLCGLGSCGPASSEEGRPRLPSLPGGPVLCPSNDLRQVCQWQSSVSLKLG